MISEYPDISNYPNNLIINILPVTLLLRRVKFTSEASPEFLFSFEVLITNIIESILISSEVTDNLIDLTNQYAIQLDGAHEAEYFLVCELINEFGTLLNEQFKSLGLYAIDGTAYYRLVGFLSDTLITFCKVSPEDFFWNLNLGAK